MIPEKYHADFEDKSKIRSDLVDKLMSVKGKTIKLDHADDVIPVFVELYDVNIDVIQPNEAHNIEPYPAKSKNTGKHVLLASEVSGGQFFDYRYHPLHGNWLSKFVSRGK